MVLTKRRTLWLALYIASIVIANAMTAHLGLIPIGFGLVVTAGTLAAGAALIVRDAVQKTSPRSLLFGAIVVGALVSSLTSSPSLAVASGLAFLVSELVDTAVFTPLRSRLALAVVLSSVVSAPIDTVLFLHLAGFPVTWASVVGQLIVKTALALMVAGYLVRKERNAVPIWR